MEAPTVMFDPYKDSDTQLYKVICQCYQFSVIMAFEDMIDHHSYIHNLSSCEIKAWKKSGLNEIRTQDLCDAGAVLYQLSFEAN